MKQTHAKNTTQALVFEAVRRNAPVTRSEIARHTGFTPATVGNTVSDLLASGLVEEVGRRPQGRGQPPIELRIRRDAACTIGLHLEHHEISAVLVDADGTILDRRAEVHDKGEPRASVLRMRDMSVSSARDAGVPLERVLGVGLAAFGPIDFEQGTVSPPIYPETWQRTPLRRMLAQEIGLPVFLENNGTAAAIGEHWYGAGKPYRDFLHVFIGFGVGGGLFVGGRVHRGFAFNAGEVGHVITELDGAPWFLGPPGSLEAVASLLAFERDFGPTGLREMGDRFEKRDSEVLSWLENAARHLAQVAVSVDHLLDLEAVVFGGLLPEPVLTHVVNRVRYYSDHLAMQNRPHRARICVGENGTFSAALGAAMLPLYDAFFPARGTGSPAAGAAWGPPPRERG